MGKHLTRKELIDKLNEKYEGRFDFSEIKFVNLTTKVKLFCKEHGEFEQTPKRLLKGISCKKCSYKEMGDTLETFQEKAIKVHGNKYIYKEYKNSRTPCKIICPIHGEFWQKPTTHLSGCGCPKCGNREKLITVTFIEKARKIHGDKYDYSKVEYVDSKTKVCIICPIHSEFWQTPENHLKGYGCSLCKESKLEREIRLVLIRQNIQFAQKYHFNWLGLQHLDFYLPKYNIGIECQGAQHYEEGHFGGIKNTETIKENLIKQQERDQRKKQLCEENGVKLLYFTHYDNVDEDNVTFKDRNKLLNEIEKYELRK